MGNNSQQATLDISARITGYQQSLKLLQQGIDQLDPGSKLKKSLVAAFKGAEDYLKKLSKTPIVDVSSDAKIHKLEQSFQQMNRLVHNVSDGFKSLTMDDISTEALNEELTETTNRISQLTARMNQLADSRHLNTLGTRVEGLRQLFSNLGANIDELGAIRGIQVLDQRIEQSTQRIQALREQAEETRRAIDSWTTIESSGIWGRAAFNDRMTVHRMLKNGQGMQNVRNVDFNQEGFSQESLDRLMEQIRSNFLTYTQRQPEIFQQISQQFNEALNQTFTLDLNPTTLRPAIQSFIQRVQNILRDSSADLTIFGTDTAGFETAILGENIDLNQFSAQWTTALERITAQANAAVEPLTRLVNIMQRWDSIDPTQVARVFQLMDLGQFQQARNLLEEIYDLEHRAVQQANEPKRQNQERLRQLNQQRREAQAELQQLQDARTTIQEDPAVQQMQQDYENLRNEVAQLREELENLRSTRANGVKALAENAAEAADKVGLTKQQVKQLQNQLANSKAAKQLVGKAQGLLKRWFSIYAAINMVSKAIKSMISTVQQLDKTITNIAIVTDMSQSDLWAQMPQYTKTAREFAASISGVYEVSQLYYQQGLQTVDVMKLTEQTLKMARISGLDYSKSTDYMTNALRSFKMEMQDATTIVDVYSAVAASSATNVSQLAQAMSKTASSAQAVGSSFENTTAMMAVMIQATRQAPENIGSAMKSIISRYGQLKTNPATLVDAEGQALSLNKVDTALQSVGISIHNAQGQFRKFDDVIMDLAQIWDTVDVNTQRYIATIMAGNRQQSRFLALVSSGERLKELSTTAAESQNAAQLQFLKTLDSVEAKQQQLQTSLQSLYTSSGIEQLYKGILDYGAQIIKVFTNIPTIGKLPIPAIMKLGTTFIAVSKLVTTAFNSAVMELKAKIDLYEELITAKKKTEAAKRILIQKQEKKEVATEEQKAYQAAIAHQREITENYKQEVNKRKSLGTGMTAKEKGGMIATGIGIAAQLGAGLIGNQQASGAVSGIGTIATGIGSILTGGIIGKITGAISLLTGAIELFGAIIVTTKEKIENYSKAIEEANNKKLQSGDQFKTLTDYNNKLKELAQHQNDSNQAKQEFIDLNAEIAAKYPELISGIDEQGNVIVQLTDKYKELANRKREAYAKDIITSGKTQLEAAQDWDWMFSQLGLDQQQLNKAGYGTNIKVHAAKGESAKEFFQNGYSNSYGENLYTLATIQSLTGAVYDEAQQQLSISRQAFEKLKQLYKFNFNIDDDRWKDGFAILNSNDMASFFPELQKKIKADIEWTEDSLTEYLLGTYAVMWKSVDELNREKPTIDLNNIENIYNYQQKFIDGIVTSSIGQLRQTFDTLLDSQGVVAGFAGAYMNQQLLSSFKDYRSKNPDKTISQQWEEWSTNNYLSQYEISLKIIKDNQNSIFTELDKYYSDLGKLDFATFELLESKYGQVDNEGNLNQAWEIFQERYYQIDHAANSAIEALVSQLNISGNIDNIKSFTANSKNRIAALGNKAGFDFNTFIQYFGNSKESIVEPILTILESSTLDTITGIENAIQQYINSNHLTEEQIEEDSFILMLKSFRESVKVNFNTQYQTLTESYTKNLKEFDKALKNATSGMGFEDAVAMAEKLGVTLKAFRREGQKWYYDEIQQIADIYIPGNDALREVLNDKSGEAGTKIIANLQTLTKDQFDINAGVSQELYNQYHTAAIAFKAWLDKNNKENSDENWNAYIAELSENFAALDEAKKDLVISNWLSVGNIDQFLANVKHDNDVNKSNLYQKALAGQLEGDLAKYQKQIIEYYQKGISAVYTAAENALNGKGATAIEVTEANASILSTLLGETITYDSEKQQTKVISADAINENWDNFKKHFEENIDNFTVQQLEAYEKIFAAKYKNNTFTNITSAISSYKGFDAAVYAKLPETIRSLAEWDDKLQKYVLNLDQLVGLSDIQLLGLGLTADQVRQIRAQIEKAVKAESNDTIVQNITKNHKALKEQNITQISKLLNISYDAAKKYLVDNGDGTYSIDLGSLKTIIEAGGISVSKATKQLIQETIKKELEDAQGLISNLAKGYSSRDSAQKIVDLVNEAEHTTNNTVQSLFEYSTALHAWVLTQDGLSKYLTVINNAIANSDNQQQKAAMRDQKFKTLLQNNQLDTFLQEYGIQPEDMAVIKTIISEGRWEDLPQGLKTYVDEFINLKKDVDNQILSNLNTAATNATKQSLIKKDDVSVDVMQQLQTRYGTIIKTTEDGDYLIDLVGAPFEVIAQLLQEIYTRQGLTIPEIVNKVQEYKDTLVHDASKAALDVLDQIANAAGGMDKTTATKLQAEFNAYGGSGQLTEWNETLQAYVFVGDTLKQFITLLAGQKVNVNSAAKSLHSINVQLIKNGQIDQFFKNINYTAGEDFWDRFQNGDIDDTVASYYEELAAYFGEGTKSVVDSAAQLLKGQTTTALITVTESNRKMIEDVFGAEVKNGQKVLVNKSDVKNSFGYLLESIENDTTKTVQQKQKQIAELWTAYYSEVNPYDAIKAVLDSPNSFDVTAYQNLPDSFKKLAKLNKETGQFAINISNITSEMLSDDSLGLTLSQINEFKAKIKSEQRKNSATTIINDIVKNREALSEENINSLATLLGEDYDEVIKQLELRRNSNGTYSIDLNNLRELISRKQLELNSEIQQAISSIIQNAIDSAKNIFINQQNGYTNFADMQKIVNEINSFGFEYSFNQLFEFNAELGAYFATTKGLFAQLAIAQSKLEGATAEERAVAQALINDVGRQLREKIDFSAFVSATFVDTKTQNAFNRSVQDYNDYLITIGQTTQYNAQKISQYILKGGAQGVAAAKQMAEITGKTISGDDLATIYKKQSNALVGAMGQITAKAGTIVGDAAAELIAANGGSIEQLANGANLVVKSAQKIVQAYDSLYYHLRNVGTATVEELNNVAAKEFEAKYQSDLMSMMTNLTDMTFSSLANIYTAADKMLSPGAIQSMLDSGAIQSLGAGKIRISSFENFAQFMNIDPKSQQYRKAFNTFNDQMIRINTQVADNIKTAASNILNASEGSQVNLTEIYTRLDSQSLVALTNRLKNLGAELNQGILTINNKQNVEKIYQQIISIGAAAGQLVESDLVQAKKTLLKRRRQTNLSNVITNIASNADQLTQDSVESLANALGIGFNEVLKYFAQGQNGYLKIEKSKLQKLLIDNGAYANLSKVAKQAVANIVNQKIEQAESIINNLPNQISNGFTNTNEIQKIVDELNKKRAGNDKFTFSEIADYNDTLNKWILSTKGIILQIQLAKAQLEQASVDSTKITQELQAMQQQLADSIDIMGYINTDDKSLVSQQFKRSLTNYNASAQAIGNSTGIAIDNLIAALDQGGNAAVMALEQFAKITNRKFTSQQYLQVFKSSAEHISTAMSELNTSIGGIISKQTVQILGLSSQVEQIGSSGNYLVKNTIDLVRAYKNLYDKMTHTAGVTLEQINNVYAQLESAKFNKQNVLSQISGDRMTLDTISEIATSLNKAASDVVAQALKNGAIKQFDNGDIQIINFDAFIKTLGIEKQVNGKLTENYKTAYKAWNDSLIENATKTTKQITQGIQNIASGNIGDYINISGLLNNVSEQQRKAITSYLEMLGVKLEAGVAFITQQAYKDMSLIVDSLLIETGQNLTRFGNQMRAQAAKQTRQNSIDNLYLSILNARESLTEDNILAIANQFGYTYNSVAMMLANFQQADGTYKLSAANVRQLFTGKMKQLSSEVQQKTNLIIQQELDQVISSVSDLSTKSFNLSQIYSTAEQINKKIDGSGFGTNDLFEFNKVLNSYTLTAQGIFVQFSLAAQKIGDDQKGLKLLEQQAQSYLGNININDLINAENMSQLSQAKSKFLDSIKDYNAAMAALGKNGLNAGKLLAALAAGGMRAVSAAKIIAQAQGRVLTDNEVKTIYRSQVDKLVEASNQLASMTIGGVVSAQTAQLLKIGKDADSRLSQGGSAVITSAQDLVAAYEALYKQIRQSGAATLEEINKVTTDLFGKRYEAKNGSNLSVEYLGKAMSMSYQQFGDMLAKAGIELTEKLMQDFVDSGIIDEIGGGLLRITDFSVIADKLGIKQNSQQYTKAFKAYNDSLIELDNQVQNNITEQIKSISNVKAGQRARVNLTQLYQDLVENDLLGPLNYVLQDYGAELSKGILTIDETANIPEIIRGISKAADESGNLLESQVQQLADLLVDIIKNFADTIANGISKGLSSADAANLANQAKNWFGIDINFTETYDGLKLSVDEATKLYYKLKQIDSAAANIVFEGLREELTGVHDNLATASSVLAQIARLEKQLQDPERKNNELLQRRLNLYKQIKVAQLDSAQSYDWMGRSLPGALQNGKNAIDSFGKAFLALNEAANTATKQLKQGEIRQPATLALEDFYNMVEQFNNLAAISGPIKFLGMELDGSMEAAAKAMQAGCNAITNVDGKGAAVNLEKFAVDFSGGAETMAKGVHEGIKAMAKSQIEMLDGLIQMLEVVVAMEDLGKLDSDSSGSLDFSEIFDWKTIGQSAVANAKAQSTAGKIIENANKKGNEDFLKGLQEIKIGNQSLLDILTQVQNGATFTKEKADQVSALLSSLYQISLSQDFDEDNIFSTTLQQLKNIKSATTLNLGDQKVVVGYGVQLLVDKDGNILDDDGNPIGTVDNPEQAIQTYTVKKNQELMDAVARGSKTAYGQFTLKDDRVVSVSGGITLVKAKDNLIHVGKKAFKTAEEARDYIANNPIALYDVTGNLEYSEIFTLDNKTYEAVAGFQWEVVLDDNNKAIGWIVDGKTFNSREAAYQASLLSFKLNNLNTPVDLQLDESDPEKAKAVIHYGTNIEAHIDGEKITYVTEGYTGDSYTDAVKAATTNFYKKLTSGNTPVDKTIFTFGSRTKYNKFGQMLIDGGFVVEVKDENGKTTGFNVNGHKYDTWDDARNAVADMLFDADGNFRFTSEDSFYQYMKGVIPIESKFEIKNQQAIKDITPEIKAKIKQALLSGKKEIIQRDLSDYIDFQWASSGDIASVEQLQQLAKIFGIDWKDQAVNLSANFADDPASKGISELVQNSSIERTVTVKIIGADEQSKAFIASMANKPDETNDYNLRNPDDEIARRKAEARRLAGYDQAAGQQSTSNGELAASVRTEQAQAAATQEIVQKAEEVTEQMAPTFQAAVQAAKVSLPQFTQTLQEMQQSNSNQNQEDATNAENSNTEATDQNTAKLQELQEQIDSLQQANQQLTSINTQQDELIQQLSDQLTTLQDKIEELTAELASKDVDENNKQIYVPHLEDHTLGSGQHDIGKQYPQREQSQRRLLAQKAVKEQLKDTSKLDVTSGELGERSRLMNEAIDNYIAGIGTFEDIVNKINAYNAAIQAARDQLDAAQAAQELQRQRDDRAAQADRQIGQLKLINKNSDYLNSSLQEYDEAILLAKQKYIDGTGTLEELDQAINAWNQQIMPELSKAGIIVGSDIAQNDSPVKAQQKVGTSGLSTQTSAGQELIWPTQNNSYLNKEELQNVLSQKYAEALSQIADSEQLSSIVSVLENEQATMNQLSVAIEELQKFFNNNNLNKGEYPTGNWNTSETGFNNELNDDDLSLAGQAQLLISTFKQSENTEIAGLAKILDDNLEKFYQSQDANREELNLAITNLITSLTEAGIAVPEYQLQSDSEGSNAQISGLDAFKEALNTVNESSTQAATQAGVLTEAQQTLATTTINTDSDIHGVVPTISAFGDKTRNLSAPLENASLGASRFARSLNQIPTNKSINVEMILTAKDADQQPVDITSLSITGTTAAKGTLMGQLGPELVVSNGRYFVVGQNGAQMVNLASDAIVFNHLQTKNLLKNNKITSRGKPVTNQRTAVAFAQGTGPAKASAREALATLQSLRAMWKSMLEASMKDLGSMAGREVGSAANKTGGGGNSGANEIRTTTAEIQRWYNLLRQIDRLEQDITYQNTLQNKLQSDRIANGQALYKSYKQQLEYLDGVISRNQQLADLQKSWYERKRNELAESDYGKIFTYDQNGLLQYRDGRNRGLDILQKLTERDIYGQPTGAAASAQSQIAYLQSIGFDTQHLKYNADGTIISESDQKYKDDANQMYQDMMNNFWDNLDGWRSELDGLYDSYRDQLNAVLENEAKRNEILQKIVDNQLSVQQDILKAIESREQKIIDELQKQRDALEKSSKQFIDGLSDQLKEQKEMYQNQENEKQLTKLRRQVAILERSGGSASQIRSLQDQIAAKEQNLYFTEREQQIAAIQKASDLEIARLDSQISIMTQTLKYQKQNGLLWQEVYQVMASTPEQIRQFIIQNTPDFQSASALDVAQKIRDIDLRINEWIGYRDDETAPSMSDYYYDWDSYFGARSSIYGSVSDEDILQQARDAFDAALQDTGDINAAGAAADAILASVWDFARPGASMGSSGTSGTGTGGTSSSGGGNGTSGSTADLISGLTRPAGISDAQWQAILDAIGRMGGKISIADLSNYTADELIDLAGKIPGGPSASQLRAMQKAAEEAAAAVGPSSSSGGPQGINNFDKASEVYETVQKINSLVDDLLEEKYKAAQQSLKSTKKYASGGLIDYTGLAMVHGSPTRPESVLSAQQTQTLRNFMTNGVDTLSSILSQIWQNMHHSSYITDTLNQEENTGVSIQHLDVNVNVEQIANDYDVRAIGNTVMDEILKIARKSGTRGLNRR